MNCEKCERIKEIFKWWDRMLCPQCGSKLNVNGGMLRCSDEWTAGAYSKCSNEKCDFKERLHYGSWAKDDWYEYEIRKILGIN